MALWVIGLLSQQLLFCRNSLMMVIGTLTNQRLVMRFGYWMTLLNFYCVIISIDVLMNSLNICFYMAQVSKIFKYKCPNKGSSS